MGNIKYSEEQKQAIDCRKNCVVVAGAGAGKTAVLSERFIALVKEGIPVESILTLTFTEKAAKEMKGRIYKRLLTEFNLQKDNQKKNCFLKKAVDEFSKSNISTIDSFCLKVLKNSPETLGLTVSFSTDEVKVKQICYLSALKILEKYKNSQVLLQWIKIYNIKSLIEKFFVPFAMKCFTLSKFWDFKELIENRAQYAELRFDDLFLQSKEIIEDLKESSKDINHAVNEGFSVDQFLEIQKGDSDFFEIISGFKFNKTKIGKDKEKKEAIDLFRKLKNEMLSLLYFLDNIDYQKEFAIIMSDYYEMVLAKKRELGALSFSDISNGAIDVLRSNKEVRDYYKNNIQYIMVDEFQDNNLLQKNLLYLLSEKNEGNLDSMPKVKDISSSKLFFVGDEKQSIYKFRGADVSVFKSLKQEIGNTIKLTKNYRSDKTLMEQFNQVFQNVMMKDEGGEEYQADYEPIYAQKSYLASPSQFEVRVNFDSEKSSKDIQRAIEFSDVVRLIKKNVNQLEVVDTSVIGGVRPCQYEDFTILLLKTTDQSKLEEILKLNNIPYNSEKLKSLYSEAIVNDMVAIIKSAIYPFDKVSLMATLRSPIISLDDDTLAKILLEEDPYQMIELLSSQNNEIGKKCAKFLFFISQIKDLADKALLTDILSYIWYETGYRFYILGNDQLLQYEEYFTAFLTFANSCDNQNQSVADFVEGVEAIIAGELTISDAISLNENKSGVNIMTIHKSKGLEFPIIILASADQTVLPKKENNNFYLLEDEKIPSQICGPVFYLPNESLDRQWSAFIKERDLQLFQIFMGEKRKNDEEYKNYAELKRLFYVAATRAESHFFMTCSEKAATKKPTKFKKNSILKTYLGRELYFLLKVDGKKVESPFFTFIDDFKEDASIRNKRAQINKLKPDLIEKAKNLNTVAIKYRCNHFSPHDLNGYFLESLYSLSKGERPLIVKELPALSIDELLKKTKLGNTQFGTLCHSLIEYQLKGLEPSQDLANSFGPNAKRVFIEAKKVVKNFMDLEILKKNYDFGSETAFLYNYKIANDHYFINAVIDFWYDDGDVIQVVDFKTDKNIVKDEYALQMFLYRRILSEYSGKPVSSRLLYLRNGQYLKVDREFRNEEMMQYFDTAKE